MWSPSEKGRIFPYFNRLPVLSDENRIDISVVIPVYNGRETITPVIQSVLDQTYPPLETIVVDDGSNDGTAGLVERTFGDRVTCITQENQGVSFARNHGAARAAGSWLAFLDSDDVWLPNKLEEQVRVIRERPSCDAVLCEVYFVDPDNNITGQSRRDADCSSREQYLNDIIKNPMLLPSTLLIKKDVFMRYGKFDESLITAEDLDFHLQLAARSDLYILDKPLVRYLRSDRGLSALKRTYDDYVHVINRFVGKNPELLTRRSAREALVHANLRAQKGYAIHGDFRASARAFGRAVRHGRTLTDGFDILKMLVSCAKRMSVSAVKSRRDGRIC
jgi:glycosyltransferase involved in cell wall biosynthesis